MESKRYYENIVEQSTLHIEWIGDEIYALEVRLRGYADSLEHAQQMLDRGEYE